MAIRIIIVICICKFWRELEITCLGEIDEKSSFLVLEGKYLMEALGILQ